MRSIISFFFLTVILGGLFAATGCHRGTGSNVGTKRIGVTLLTREHEFYRQLEAGLKNAADQHGYQLIVTSGDFDLAKQQSQIDNFILQHVDAIIVCPADSKGIAPAIERANLAKIPVFTADIAAQGGTVISHVASDNLAGGRLAAEYVAHALNGEGSVGIIGQPETQTAMERQTAFSEEIKKYPTITIASGWNGGGVRDRAMKAADDMLQGSPNLKAIFGINDDTALGALSAAEARGRNDLIIVGYDATPEAVKAIQRGSALKADVAQQPRDIGAKTIDVISTYFGGGQASKNISIPVKIVDANSLKQTAAAN